jgi:hypothetical protein
MVMERDSSSPSLSSLSAYGHLAAKCPFLPQIKHFKGRLPFYLPDPLFSFLANCAYFVFDSQLEQSPDISS